jgi:hypothetical protein
LGQHQQAAFYFEFENYLLVEAGPDLPGPLGQDRLVITARQILRRYRAAD